MPRSEITQLLEQWGNGDQEAVVKLLPLVYDELRALAAVQLRHERPDHTLETAALVHEAYLRLVGQDRTRWHNRLHFFRIAAQAMRRILVDHARGKLYAKRGGGCRDLSLDEALSFSVDKAPELVALDEALEKLASLAPRQAQIVELRYFTGLTSEEIARALDISIPTVTREWRTARAWLYRSLSEGDADGP